MGLHFFFFRGMSHHLVLVSGGGKKAEAFALGESIPYRSHWMQALRWLLIW
jgi:hypothetical protein